MSMYSNMPENITLSSVKDIEDSHLEMKNMAKHCDTSLQWRTSITAILNRPHDK